MHGPPNEPKQREPAVEEKIRTAYPNGHFYSPVVDTATLSAKKDRI